MAKKNLLGGFKFQKLPEISNGLIIPTGNYTRPKLEFLTTPSTPDPLPQAPKPKIVKQLQNHNFRKLELDSKAFTPMTNVVPTIENIPVPDVKPIFKGLSRRARQRASHEDLDLTEFAAQETIGAKILYLSLRGWSLKIKGRGNGFYRFATKYLWKSRDGKGFVATEG